MEDFTRIFEEPSSEVLKRIGKLGILRQELQPSSLKVEEDLQDTLERREGR
jgi:hypothetical protein